MKAIESSESITIDLSSDGNKQDGLKKTKFLANAVAKSMLPSIQGGTDPSIQKIKDLEQEIDNLKR